MDLQEFLGVANEALDLGTLSQMVGVGNLGGYLCVFDSSAGLEAPPLLLALVGRMDDVARRGRCVKNALDKAKRLLENPDHISSWQSRDVTAEPKRYGGGIRANDFVITFSGFPEHGDEAIVLYVALQNALWLDGEDKALVVASISENPLILGLLDELSKVLPF